MQHFDFLSVDDILFIHQDQIKRYGGTLGILNQGLLESAVALPRMMFNGDYVHTGIHEMAAAYLFHLGKNHPFLDGNKRTATVAALVFLHLNGYDLTTDNEKLTETVLAVMSNEMTKSELADFFKKSMTLR